MMNILNELESQILNKWFRRAPAEVVFHLAKPMLLRNPEDLLLRLNFDPAVIFFKHFLVRMHHVEPAGKLWRMALIACEWQGGASAQRAACLRVANAYHALNS